MLLGAGFLTIGEDENLGSGLLSNDKLDCIQDFAFLDGDVPRHPSFGVYILQHIRFARACSNANDFNNRNTFLTSKLLKLGYDTINFVKLFF